MAPWLPVAEVRLAHRSVPEVEAEERVAGTEHLPERPRFLAWRRPDLNLGNAVAGAEHAGSLCQGAQHQPSTRGNEAERNCFAMFETARMRRGSAARMKTHWSAAGHVTSSQRPSGDQITSSK